MKTIHIKPKAGLVVRDPETAQQLAANGEHKTENAYWRRRLNAGDVELVTAPQAGGKGKQGKE